jgi:predicted nuclease with TOPRIM domain
MSNKRIKVRDTKEYSYDFEGAIEYIISELQSHLDDGWQRIELNYSDYSDYPTYYLYREREETDKEYEKRMKQLEVRKERRKKEKEKRLKQLQKEISSLSEEERKLLEI